MDPVINTFSANSDLVNVVLDIDGVLTLANGYDEYPASLLEEFPYLSKVGSVIHASSGYFYIQPGVKEFLKALYSTENVRVSFFSAGPEKRNHEFVPQILNLSLGEKEYEKIKANVTILSRSDLIKLTDKEADELKKSYGIIVPNDPKELGQKDISLAVKNSGRLENSVLIDDQIENVASGQAKNYLYAPPSKEDDFITAAAKFESYNPNGYRTLKFTLFVDETFDSGIKNILDKVEHGKSVYITKENNQFEFYFFSLKTSKVQKETISSSTHNSLFNELNQVYDRCKKDGCDIEELSDNALSECIQFVMNANGKEKKICRSLNRIFHTAGLFFLALELSKINKIPISDILFQMHYIKTNNSSTYNPHLNIPRQLDNFYEYGLKKLQEVNPKLCFTSPHHFKQVILDDIKEVLSNEESYEDKLNK